MDENTSYYLALLKQKYRTGFSPEKKPVNMKERQTEIKRERM